jgi:phenylalanyl-tRNA synthetase beta chain
MRIPLSWLKDFVDITIPIDELAQRLTFAGLEVEGIEYIGVPGGELPWDRDKIFVGQLLKVEKHPNADKLTLATVEYGAAQPITVVTGAPNIKPGDSSQKVVLALRGARLYDGHKAGRVIMTLKEANLRGIKNDSMVCSEKELGMSEEHEGIIILPDDAPVGTPFVDYMGDVVFDIKINPNFARAQAVLGVAREVAALTGQKVKVNEAPSEAGGAETDFVKIEIADSSLCGRYSALLIRDVEIQSSPWWMQRRLTLAGMRPINNIVDITNYVMIEWGQPLHAFDYDKLVARASGGVPTIIVRAANAGEKIQTLDGVTRELKPTDLLITDTVGPIAIAGVMGGAETEVSETTKNVLLESANFNYISIRRTTQEQKLPSEAATRFGRGISPVQTIPAAMRAAELMRELAGGRVDADIADAYPAPIVEPTIELTTREVKRLLGIEISPEQITKILRSLDFQVTSRGDGTFTVTPPNYRLDVDGDDDVIEELARVYGYERIPSTLIADELPPLRENIELEREEQARDLLIELGLQEVRTYTLTHPAREGLLIPTPNLPRRTEEGEFDPLPSRPYVEIENPISVERSVLRQSLLPSVLDIVASNLRYADRAALFEIGKVYLARTDGETSADDLPEDRAARLPLEKRRLTIAMTGPRDGVTWNNQDSVPMDFYDLKGVVEEFADGLQLRDVTFVVSSHPSFHPGRAAALWLGGREVGVFGELHPVVREKLDLPAQTVLVGEFDLDAILGQVETLYRIEPISRYPAVVQDIALIVDESVAAARVEELIRQTGGALLTRLQLFDVYRGEPLPPGKKSLAYRLTFQAFDRGLSDTDAAKIREKIVGRLRRELGAELRST